MREKLQKMSAVGIFTKESEPVTAAQKETLWTEMNSIDSRIATNEVENNIQFLGRFFNHVQMPEATELYARDIEEPPAGITSKLKDVTSLISSREEIPGVNTPMFYAGSAFSNTVLHDEDASLPSINLHRSGEPKIWLVVDHTMKSNLLLEFADYLRRRGGKKGKICPLQLQHKLYVVSPTLLDTWGINYVVFEQKPGDMVFLRGGSYHFVVNKGKNIAEAMNFANDEWNSQIGVALPLCHCRESKNADVYRDRTRYSVQIASGSKWHECSEANCKKRFKTIVTLRLHLRNDHGNQLFTCDVCDKNFSTATNLHRHRSIHDDSMGLRKCSICGKEVRQLSKHMLIHNEDNREECPICNRKISKRNLSKHVKQCNVHCTICDKTFSTKRYLSIHQKTVHSQ